MERKYDHILAKHEDNGLIPLSEHLLLVANQLKLLHAILGLIRFSKKRCHIS